MSKFVKRWCPICNKSREMEKLGDYYLKCLSCPWEGEEYVDKSVLKGGKAVKALNITNPGGG